MDIKDNMEIRDFIELVYQKVAMFRNQKKENTIESRTRLENINEFLSVAVDFDVNNPDGNLEDFYLEYPYYQMQIKLKMWTILLLC